MTGRLDMGRPTQKLANEELWPRFLRNEWVSKRVVEQPAARMLPHIGLGSTRKSGPRG
jgi:hypothetical protein